MKLLQFTDPDSTDRPIAINPHHVSWVARNQDYYDDKRRGTIIQFTAGSAVLVAESYETVLDALQAAEVEHP